MDDLERILKNAGLNGSKSNNKQPPPLENVKKSTKNTILIESVDNELSEYSVERYRREFDDFMNNDQLNELEPIGKRQPSNPENIAKATAAFVEYSQWVGYAESQQLQALKDAAGEFNVKPWEIEAKLGRKVGALDHQGRPMDIPAQPSDISPFRPVQHEDVELDETAGVGVNAEHNTYPYTPDIKKGTLKKTGAKLGFDITDDGIPPQISKDSIKK